MNMFGLSDTLLLCAAPVGTNYVFDIAKILLQALCTAGFGWLVAMGLKRKWFDEERSRTESREQRLLLAELFDLEQHYVDNLSVLKSIMEPVVGEALAQGKPSMIHFEMLLVDESAMIFRTDTIRSVSATNVARLNDIKVLIRNANIVGTHLSEYVQSDEVEKAVLLDYLSYAIFMSTYLQIAIKECRRALGKWEEVVHRTERMPIVYEPWPTPLVR